jgi:hypothetical protein
MNGHTIRLALFVLALALTAGVANGQIMRNLVVLNISDAGTGSGICTLGVHTNGTYAKDPSLDSDLGEEELPPVPPTGVFDARFVDHRTPGQLGTGQRVHIQPVAVTDTFRLLYQASDAGFPITITWDSANTNANWVSLRMLDAFGGLLGVNFDMRATNTATVTNNLITVVNIIGTSTFPVDVEKEGNLIPQTFALEQNYPNPFNPSTTISFAIEKAAFTDIAIYNVVGQRVKTLASENLTPGFYTTTWHGTDDNNQAVTSGVYFVRMSAVGQGAEFTGLRKLLLMK